MPPRLILRPGETGSRSFDLTSGTVTLGRADDNDIHLLDRTLSRHHARIEVVDGEVTLQDLGSRNGTYVNDQALVGRRSLAGGERIRLGAVPFAFLAERVSVGSPPGTVIQDVRDIEADLSRLSLAEVLGEGRAGMEVDSQVRDRDRLRILLKVSQLLSSPASLDALLERIVELALEILPIDRVTLLLAEENRGEASASPGSPLEVAPLEVRVTRLRDGISPPESGTTFSRQIVEHVRDRKIATLFSDAQADPRLGDSKSVLRQSICASMCAPLMPRDRVLGVLYADNLTRPDPFTPADLDLLTAFANQAAIALENSLLYSRLEREAVTRNNLLRFFPPSATGRILAGEVSLGVRETEITALFADISSFTALSARLSPREVVDLLNAYFPAMAEIVFQHEGTLEKYIGDALLAVWGAPVGHTDDAARAVRAAVDMQRAVEGLRRRTGLDLDIHVGLNTGVVAAGNIGSERYLQYATIGDATNMASRISDLAGAGEIYLSAATHARLTDLPGAADLPPCEALPGRRVKGRDELVEVYRVDWGGV